MSSKRLRKWFVTIFCGLLSVHSLPISGQSRGQQLEIRLVGMKKDYDAIERQYGKDYQSKFQGTVDSIIYGEISVAVEIRLRDTEASIQGLEYDQAEKALSFTASEMRTMQTIVQEAAGLPAEIVRSESKVDQHMDQVQDQLSSGLSGIQLRALIYNESLVVSKLFDKAKARRCPDIGPGPDAKYAGISGIYMVGGVARENFTRGAHDKLLMLLYDDAHAMNLEAYNVAIKILAACGH